jgi:predicted metal-dependent TIM-barrel fold hydrolase
VERVLVPCSPTGERKASRQAWADRFDRLIEFEARRAQTFGIRLCAALAVCASDATDTQSAIEGVDEVASRLGGPTVAAIGEVSLRTFSDLELELFRLQLRLATSWDYPVIIEAPIEMPAFERMLVELEHVIAAGLATPRRICLIDVNREKIKAARPLNLGAYGVPVSPRVDGLFSIREKLDHREVLRILDEFGPDGLMLNSGLHVGFADPLCLPKTVLRLRIHGLDLDTLIALAKENASGFFQPPSA